MNMIMNATIINQYSNGQPLIMERYHIHDTARGRYTRVLTHLYRKLAPKNRFSEICGQFHSTLEVNLGLTLVLVEDMGII